MSCAHECHESRATRGRLALRRHGDRVAREVRQALNEEAVGAHAAVKAHLLQTRPDFALRGLEKIGSALGDSSEYRTNQVSRARSAGESEESSPGAEVPARRAEPRERGD